MQSKLFLAWAAALVVPLACSANTRDDAPAAAGHEPGADLALPAGLENSLLEGELPGGLSLIAFTLIQGARGAELYAAVRNDGRVPACEAGMTTYFVDKAEQLVTTAGSILQSGRFYRLSSGVIITCVDPGQVAMAGSSELPSEIVIGELGYLKHAFPAFTLDDLTAIDALSVSEVRVVRTSGGGRYTGTLTNQLDTAARAAHVTFFPVNRVGRPLGMASAAAPTEIVPGGNWSFETGTLNELGVDYVAYPAASFGL